MNTLLKIASQLKEETAEDRKLKRAMKGGALLGTALAAAKYTPVPSAIKGALLGTVAGAAIHSASRAVS